MSDDQVQEVLKRVDALAAKLGIGAEALWGILLQQAKVEAIIYVAFVVCVALAWIVFWRVLLPKYSAAAAAAEGRHSYSEAAFNWGTGCVIVGALNAFLTLFAVILFWSFVTQVVNPDYWAFNELMRKLR